MYNREKPMREEKLKRNAQNPPLPSSIPSFSSSLLDEIYRSIDQGNGKSEDFRCYRDRIVKKQSNVNDKKAIVKLRRASLVENWIGKNEFDGKSKQLYNDSLFSSSESSSSDSSSSFETEFSVMSKSRSTSCFSATRPKPVRTTQCEKLGKASHYQQSECYYLEDYHHYQNKCKKNELDSKHDDGLIKSKTRALKIYNNLKKMKQPISPGGRLSSFLNSLFAHGNSKKMNNLSSSTLTSSTCSSASSYTRSCLNRNTSNPKQKSNNGGKRSVSFYPMSVIIDEDCRPCGQKPVYKGSFQDYGAQIKEDKRKIEEAKRGYLKRYDEFDEEDDVASDSSSDLFELDHLSFIGNNGRYSEELPVYETTHLDTNFAIANGLIC